MSFRVIPVIDLKDGMAVHAIAGRRDQYRTLRSVWQATASPIALAVALHEGLGVDCLYVADLDAIEGTPADLALHDRLASLGREVWLDAGIRDRTSLEPFMRPSLHAVRIVVGLESLAGPTELGPIIGTAGPERIVFSLDLDAGRPRIAGGAEWRVAGPLEIVRQAVECGVRRIILLDLTRVGTGRGIGTEGLLASIRRESPGLDITVGAGIRGIDDVLALRDQGASGVLVGTAIHDARIGRRDLERIAAADRGESDPSR